MSKAKGSKPEQDSTSLELSLVVPMFEEQDNAWPLYQAIDQALADHNSWEAIFVAWIRLQWQQTGLWLGWAAMGSLSSQ